MEICHETLMNFWVSQEIFRKSQKFEFFQVPLLRKFLHEILKTSSFIFMQKYFSHNYFIIPFTFSSERKVLKINFSPFTFSHFCFQCNVVKVVSFLRSKKIFKGIHKKLLSIHTATLLFHTFFTFLFKCSEKKGEKEKNLYPMRILTKWQ